MARLIRATDWSGSPLGPPESWPQSLRTTVSLCLASNFPINIIWGPEHVQIYNDGYRIVCGEAHPRSLGEAYTKTWASAWPAIGEPFERALAGETSFLENQRMFLTRNGYLEETFFTFSLSPIRDETGGIGGLFHPVNETTASMLAERRTRAVRDLNARLTDARSTSEVCAAAAETLGCFDLDLPFVLIYELVAETGAYRLASQAGLKPGVAAAPNVLAADAARPWPVGRLVQTREPAQRVKLGGLFRDRPCGPYEEPPDAAIAAPICIPGSERPVALLIAGASPRLPWDEAYANFFSLLAASLASGLANARFYEEQRQRAEALAALDRAKTTFFSNVSHEFRTPLTLLLGPIQDALDEAADLPEAQYERLQVAHRNAQRLLKLVNSLLDFSRIEAGRTQARFEPTDLAALTADLASNFRSACERAGLALVVDCPPLPAPVYVDRQMWEKIVLNLVSNAFKFTLDGQITVSLCAHGEHAELVVRDTGVGIAETELPRIFERFHRIEGQNGRTHEGTGIGLALVDELVKLQGGAVEAESRAGHGSAFRVTIPFGDTHLAPARSEGAALSSTATAAGAYVAEALRWLPGEGGPGGGAHDAPAPVEGAPRVVLADDNADMRGYVQRLLEQGGYTVEAVENGLAALEAIRRGPPPDLLLSDVMMPGMDGFALLAAVRSDPGLKSLLVVLLSARAGEEARVEGLAVGADDYLVKPFSARELRARVDGAVALARQRRLAAAREKALQGEIASAEARAALRQTEQQFAFALRAGRLGSWELDLRTGQFSASEYCRINFGLGPDDPFDRYEDLVARVHPDDRNARQQAIDQAISAEADMDVEYRIIKPGGAIGWILARGRPDYENGRPVRMAGVLLDITQRKAAEERQRLLLDELNHRVKNTLASVQAIAMQTRRFATEASGFDEAFIARIGALARAHDLLSEASWEGASLEDVIARTLAPHYSWQAKDRVSFGGPGVRLGPNAAVTLNMAFHELATNAAKYGSLAAATGRVDVAWRIAGPEAGRAVEIDWREAGGPRVSVPTRRGFGSRLIERGLVHELAGEAHMSFQPEGLWCRIWLPFSDKLGLAA
jgi:signal transduction histidine kinase/CheY-like chemotaxis protein